MRRLLVALAFILPAGGALAAIGYSKFSHPKGDYTLEYPSDWKQSYGLQSLRLRPPGRTGSDVRVSIELFPAGKSSPKSIQDYISGLSAETAVKKVGKPAETTVSGLRSYRLEMTETAVLSDKYGPLPGPLREVHVLVPFEKDRYYVLKIEGLGRSYQKTLPEFERLVKNIKIRS